MLIKRLLFTFLLTSLLGLVLPHTLAEAGQRQNPFTGKPDYCSSLTEADGSPAITGCQSITVTNGSLTDNGDGTFVFNGGTAWDDLLDPDANTTIDFTTFTTSLTSTLDGGSILALTDTDTDFASDTIYVDLNSYDIDDANGIFFRARSDTDGTPTTVFQVSQTGLTAGVPMTFTGTAGTPGSLKLYEDPSNGTNFTLIQTQAQSADITYNLPASAATVTGQWLVNDALATQGLSWSNTLNLSATETLTFNSGQSDALLSDDLILQDDHPALQLWGDGNVAYSIHLHNPASPSYAQFGIWKGINTGSGFVIDSPWTPLLAGDSSNNLYVGSLVSCDTIDTDGQGKLTCGTDSGGGGNSFETQNVPSGTDPVADSSTDTLNWTSTGSTLTLTGNSGTDTINLEAVDVTCTDCLGTTEIADSYVLNTGDTITGAIDINDGAGNSPALSFTSQTGNNFGLYIEDTDQDLQVQANTASTETIDIVNIGAGVIALNVDGGLVLDATTEANIEAGVDLAGEVTATDLDSTVIADTVTVTGWVLGTSSATTLTTGTINFDLADGVGAVDMDYGSADITDHTFTTDGGVIILDGSATIEDDLIVGTDLTARAQVDGNADEIQLLIQGNATQTSNLITFENSSGTDQLTLSNVGNGTLAGTLTVGGTAQSTITEGLIVNNGSGTDEDDDFTVNVSGAAYEIDAGAGTFTSTANSFGWSVVSGADTACTTTCTSACVFGVNTASLTADIVDCADATADECLCGGSN